MVPVVAEESGFGRLKEQRVVHNAEPEVAEQSLFAGFCMMAVAARDTIIGRQKIFGDALHSQ